LNYCASEANLELFNKQLISRFEMKGEKLVEIGKNKKRQMQAMKIISPGLPNYACPTIVDAGPLVVK
jgi:hypothetical protein